MTGYPADAAPGVGRIMMLTFRQHRSDIAGVAAGGLLGSLLPLVAVHLDGLLLLGTVDPVRLAAAAVVLAAALGMAFPLMQIARRPVLNRWPRHPQLVLAGVLLADTAGMLLLETIMPFRAGLLSMLCYCLPALAVAPAVAVRSGAAARAAVAALVAVCLLAVPVRLLQQHVAAQEWLQRTRIPRSLAQVVSLPGMTQEAYYRDGRSLVAVFDLSSGTGLGGGAETVTPGYADPCGPVLADQGDAEGYESDPCTPAGPGLWQRGSAGYVLQRDGVTITVTAVSFGDTSESSSVMRRAILDAHQASNAELWSREGQLPANPIDLLLL